MNKDKQAGQVMPLIAVASIALVALFGLAVDGGSLMMHRTQLQKVADAAALGLVINCPTNTTDDSCKNDTSPNTGAIVSAVNPSEAGFSIATLHPRDSNCPDPSTQSYCAVATATTTWDTAFIGLVGTQQLNTQAVGIAGRGGQNPMCLITANSTFINGNVSIGTVGCAMALGGFSAAGNSFNISSSSPNNGIDLYNGVPASACGTNCSPAANSHTGSVPVPLFDTTKLPAVPTTLGSCLGCKPNGSTKCPSGSCTYTPGLYNSSIDCSSNGNCTLNRGDYYFSGTNGIIGPSNKNSGTIDGSAGVLIWLNGGNFDTGGGGPIILKPKTSSSGCTYTASEQTVIYSANGSGTITFQGNSSLSITGNIYAPNYTLKLQGTPANSDVDSSIVVGNLTTGGNPTFQINISTAETCVFTNPGRIRLLQ